MYNTAYWVPDMCMILGMDTTPIWYPIGIWLIDKWRYIEIDKFIQQTQLNANKHQKIIEWILFDRLENVTYLSKRDFGTVCKAEWLNRYIILQSHEKWVRFPKQDVYLKSLDYFTNKNDFFARVIQALNLCYITDFGLHKPVSENDSEKIYGVISYMAPETLSRGEYTQASDIYSFGMVMLEVLTKIMEKCELLNCSTAKELKSQLDKYNNIEWDVANKSNKNFIQYDPNEMHPEAIYTSRLIPKLTIPECNAFAEYDTFIEEEENETQEMKCKFNSLGIN
ncbi:hypothetical protein Glove_395g28 [Diversispora epigaea]|uniref:Protein kinase domain-containing protein n=1 Tax=Diversispora epigaea TaxID=1348612 RepID=A0A397H6D8_9GLOM|nr:hypothetical protein Glove_395g28 [Diversispora epigaea]